MPALRDSIAANGIIQPLVVRKRKEGGYEIGAGVRRMKAAQMAELKTLPCVVVDLDDEDFIALQVDENRQRESIHPIDEALYCHELSERGLSADQVAKKIGLKKRDVLQKLRLLALSAAARKAFVAGKFDEESALSLASTTDSSKQADILAALDAGTLQPEEITGYIRRTFTATLDDVPWRHTDEKLVVKAGACATCPKRSDVQRDMFPKDAVGLRCLDVDCWRSKMEATWQSELARPGVSLLDQTAESLFTLAAGDARPVVLRASGMVDSDATCKHLPTKTWREAVFSVVPEDAEAPTVYLARDQDGRPRFLMREAVVDKMVRKSDAAKAIAEERRAADPVRPDEDSRAAARAETKVRKTLIQQFAERVISGDHDTWDWVAGRVIDGATPRAISIVHEMFSESIRGLDGEKEALEGKAGLAMLITTSNRQARRVATAVLIFEDADLVGEISPALRALAARCEIDLTALEREIRGAK